MACVIAAPSSGSGKTTLCLLLASWARSQRKNIQTFKVGPDYLDPKQLTAITQKPCRNLDLILCGEEWVKNCFFNHSNKADLVFVEGVMGLFDGLGSSQKGSTSELANLLNLEIILVINAKGQAASIQALVKGFIELKKELTIAGVVLNNVNTERHKILLTESLQQINVKVLGCLPTKQELNLSSNYLGIKPCLTTNNLEEKIEIWNTLSKRYLDMDSIQRLLKSEFDLENKVQKINSSFNIENSHTIAIAQDNAFHFRYPETKECLEEAGINVIEWQILNDEPIPKEAEGIILPGGFPEDFAKEISDSKRSLSSIRSFFGKKPIYAECGGMLILGQSLYDNDNRKHNMTGLLPFESKKGNLRVGYRKIKALNKGLISSTGEVLNGHEFHKWEVKLIKSKKSLMQNILQSSNDYKQIKLYSPWEISGWGIKSFKEGWGNNLFHASWIHLHWPSSKMVVSHFKNALKSSKKIST